MPDEVIVRSYTQRCYTFGSLFVGVTGGMALGFLTKVPETKPLYMISTIPQIKPFLKKVPQLKLVTGANNMWARLALQGLGTAIAYSFLECKFQYGHRRTMFDAGLAGAITGGGYGMRGIPGSRLGAAYGAGGLALYAILMQLLFR